MQGAFWPGKRVLITGHTGFKGGWLALWLHSLGARVSGYALPPQTDPSFFQVCKVGDLMASVVGDIRDFDSVRAVIAEQRPEIVFHLAAQPLVRYSYEQPVETYSTNVLGTVHVLEAVRQVGGVRVFVNVTSDKCYENREWVWGYRESDPLGGYDPYSSSKGCAELVTAAYRQSYFHPAAHGIHQTGLASVRAGNVIGGGDWAADRLVPDVIRAISRGDAVAIRNPHAVRPWQHVLEPLSGYLLLAQRLWEQGAAFAEAWNFGPGDQDTRPVSWIAEYLTKRWGEGARWISDDGQHPHEATHLKLDCSKANGRLGWWPRWSLAKALDSIVEWHQAFISGKNMRELSLRQIEEYSQASPGV